MHQLEKGNSPLNLKTQYSVVAMPKKFKGENSKAAAARERKQAAKHEADEKKRQAEEDAYWKDDDKHAQRKQDRKVNETSKSL